jgi:hypothetical protein
MDTCSAVSSESGLKNDCRPEALSPNCSLMRAPSSMMELKRLFWPTAVSIASWRSPKTLRSVTMEFVRAMSPNDRCAVGWVRNLSRVRTEPAPLALESRSSTAAPTVNFSMTTTSGAPRMMLTSASSPNCVVMSVISTGFLPEAFADKVYGPPTIMPRK